MYGELGVVSVIHEVSPLRPNMEFLQNNEFGTQKLINYCAVSFGVDALKRSRISKYLSYHWQCHLCFSNVIALFILKKQVHACTFLYFLTAMCVGEH